MEIPASFSYVFVQGIPITSTPKLNMRLFAVLTAALAATTQAAYSGDIVQYW